MKLDTKESRVPKTTSNNFRSEANVLHLSDPFAEADEDTGETKQSQNYIHIRIQRTFHNFQLCQFPQVILIPLSLITNTDTLLIRAEWS